MSRQIAPLLLSLLAPAAQAWEEHAFPQLFQTFLGGLVLDDQHADWEAIGGEAAEVEFPSAILSLGGEAEYALAGSDSWRWGFNPGGSIAWKSSGTRVAGSVSNDSGALVHFTIDNGLFIGELHAGVFLRAGLAPRVSAYAAAGPMLMYGKLEVDGETQPGIVSGSEASDFDVGYYARSGIDYRYARGKRFGVGLRYLATELDFSDTFGQMDIEGPQFIFSYTAEF